MLKLAAHYTGSRAQSANTERDTSNHDVTMFGMSRCRQTLSKSISDHQISAKRHEDDAWRYLGLIYMIVIS